MPAWMHCLYLSLFPPSHTHSCPTPTHCAWFRLATRSQLQSGQSRDNPNMDPMSPAQLSMCFGVKGLVLGLWESLTMDEGFSLFLLSPCSLIHQPLCTSMLVVIGSRGRHDLTWPIMMGHQMQEGCPGWEDVRENSFLGCPPKSINIHLSMNPPFLPFALKQRGGAAGVAGQMWPRWSSYFLF